MEEYIERHIDTEPEYLKELFRDANRQLLYTRMMSGHLQGRFLKMLMQMIKPSRVLEIGTFAGYATLCLAEGTGGDTVIDTIEINDELETFIIPHFEKSPYSQRINLHIGDALDIIPCLHRQGTTWDVAYIDGDKRLYPEYYATVMPALAEGGWIIADNTLWNGRVTENPETLKHDHKSEQLAAIIRFNDIVGADENVEKVILPLRDGMTIIRKK